MNISVSWERFNRSSRAKCKACPRFKHGVFVPPKITTSPLMFIAEAPGTSEMAPKEQENREPMIGATGKLASRMVSTAGGENKGISFHGSSKANAVLCGVKGNAKPEAEEVECCAGLVNAAIKQAKPELVVAFGEVAKTRLLGQAKKLGPWRGSLLNAEKIAVVGKKEQESEIEFFKSGPRKGKPKPIKVDVLVRNTYSGDVLPTYHPSQVMRSGFLTYPLVLADIKRAIRYVTDDKRLVEVGAELSPSSWQDGTGVAKFIKDRKRICVDIEADRASGRVTMIGIARSPTEAIMAKPTKQVRSALNDALDESTTFIAHNAQYDIRKLKQLGVSVDGFIFDTMHAAQLERPDLRDKQKGAADRMEWNKLAALDMVASRMPNLLYYNWKEEFRSGESYSEDQYNLYDTTVCYYLADELERRLKNTNRWKYFSSIMMPLVPVLMQIEDDGFNVDEEVLNAMQEKQEVLIAKLEREWEKDKRLSQINPNSPKALMEYVYDELGIPPVMKRAANGKMTRTLDKHAVEKLAATYPEVKALSVLNGLRHAKKIRSTYLDPELRRGRWHFEFNMSGTRTGRLSSNAQQFPRPEKAGMCEQGVPGCQCGRIRSIFMHDEGDIELAVADYSQIEARITALLAEEHWLIRAFEQDEFDYHTTTAELLSKYTGKHWDRKDGKKANHALNYVMGEKGVMLHFDCDKATAREILNAMHKSRPATVAWWRRLQKHVEQYGWVAEPFGRRFYFVPDKSGRYEMSKVVASIPQSAAYAVIAKAMIRAHDAGLKLRMQAHDEIAVSCEYEDDAEILKEIMEMPVEELNDWRCPADMGVGRTWEEAKLKS